MAVSLTKSNFMSGLQCHKQLWLAVKEPHRATPLNLAQQRIIDQGEMVGQYARQQFLGGQLIEGNGSEAIQATQEAILAVTPKAIAAGATCLFEAAFNFDGIFIRSDILQQTSATNWELIEVKSSSKVKDEHYWDLALQHYVLTRSGLSISSAKLMHINTEDCFFPHLDNLFTLVDISTQVKSRLPEIPAKLDHLKAVLTQDSEPPLAIGKHCDHPDPCPFKDDCWQNIPDVSIFTIPRLDWKKKDALIAQGILAIADLPASFRLTDIQQTYVDTVLSSQPAIDQSAIAAALAQLEYPIHFFDFEAQNPAIPRFDRLKPYEQFPFQYSCHILQADGSTQHCEYLHTEQSDPRPPLIAALTTDVAAQGSVVVYHKSFEATLLRKLAKDFPEFALELEAIANRLWDLEDIFKSHYKHPEFRGSTSIKNVLPVLVPSLSYKTLTVQRGDQAQTIWETMIACTSPSENQQLADDLRTYCRLDTQAMLEIYQSLAQISVA
jgi:hypothetical protein